MFPFRLVPDACGDAHNIVVHSPFVMIYVLTPYRVCAGLLLSRTKHFKIIGATGSKRCIGMLL